MIFDRFTPSIPNWKQLVINVGAFLLLAYISICLFLFFQQRQLIYRPDSQVSMQPSNSAFTTKY
ncbi:MAG: hypothetical protein AAGF83_13505 [Cyanobacteria bacterium P01_G01_bin.67]